MYAQLIVFADCGDGFTGKFCNQTCPSNCLNKICGRHDTVCQGCMQDYWSEDCSMECGNCMGDICGQANGTCQDGCDDGYFGPTCTTECLYDGCQACSSSGQCVSCKQGKWGMNCDVNCNNNCYPSSGEIYCHKSNGTCSSGQCVDGFFSDDCTSECNVHCGTVNNSSKPCNVNTGYCLVDDCKGTWYGPTCNQRCPATCVNQNCNRTGDCVEGCIEEHWGSMCDEICTGNATCNDNSCDQVAGICMECEKQDPLPLCRTAGTLKQPREIRIDNLLSNK